MNSLTEINNLQHKMYDWGRLTLADAAKWRQLLFQLWKWIFLLENGGSGACPWDLIEY